MVFFDKCDVAVNGTGIMADSASLSSENVLTPIYVVGYKGIKDNSPGGNIKNTFQINYFIEPNRSPNFSIINDIKTFTNDNTWTPQTVEIGTITGFSSYLQSFNLKVPLNQPAKASVSYVSFNPTSGVLQDSIGSIGYDETSELNLLHGWSTFITSSGNYTSIKIFDFEYGITVNWSPIYTLGRFYPNQVELMGGAERLTIVTDNFYEANFYGTGVDEKIFNFGADTSIDLFGFKRVDT